MPIAGFVSEIEDLFNVRVKDWKYSVDNGWSPMKVQLNQQQYNNFIFKFGENGQISTARYQAFDNGIIIFEASRGNDIKGILSNI